MGHGNTPRILVALVALGGWQSGTLAQCGADGEIPDRTTLDAILGGSQTLEDFESFQIASGGAVNLDTATLDSTTIANGQGPGLVEPGATYIDPGAIQLQWNGDQYFNRTTKTLLANGGASRIDITYSPAVQAMGVDLSGFEGFGYTGTASIYDTSNNLVGTVSFSVGGGASRDFIGWQHAAGIGRVELFSADWPWSPKIDDHGYGDCDDARFKFYCNVADGHPNNTAQIKVTGNVLSQPPIQVCMGGGPPGQFAYLLIGSNNGIVNQPPGAKGDLCVAGGNCLGRYAKDVGQIDSGGQFCTDIFNSVSGGANYGIPSCGGNIQTGETWYFQYWHRQPIGQPATFSEAVCVTFKQ